ncbi:MAG: TonB family protein [Beijerinckiaceae bacterium]
MEGLAEPQRLFVTPSGARSALAPALIVSLAMHLAAAAAFYGWRTPGVLQPDVIDVELVAEQDSARTSDIPTDVATESAAGANAEAASSDAVPPSAASNAQMEPAPAGDAKVKASLPDAADEPLPDRQETQPPKQTLASAASAQQTASLLSADEAEADRRRSIQKAWLGTVSAELNRRRVYPASARDKGITGAVRVAFGLDAAGRVSHYEIVGSSGHDVLDEAVRRMMGKVRTPPPPDGPFETAVTIRFGLR